jgi:hypothetical protein
MSKEKNISRWDVLRSFLEVKKGYLQLVLAATVFSLREHEGENQRGGG